MRTGTPKFTAVALGRFDVDLLGTTVKLVAKFAFVDPATGGTYAWAEGGQWSPETMQALKVLRESMEADAAKLFFTGDGVTIQEASRKLVPEDDGNGLGEHLGSVTDAPSIG